MTIDTHTQQTQSEFGCAKIAEICSAFCGKFHDFSILLIAFSRETVKFDTFFSAVAVTCSSR